MREIKFRGKYIDTNEWVYGYYLKQERHVIFDPSGIGTYYVIDSNTLGQFTGLHDKTGKEKYKDDIEKSGNGRIWVIKHGYYKIAMPGNLIGLYGWYMQDGECQKHPRKPGMAGERMNLEEINRLAEEYLEVREKEMIGQPEWCQEKGIEGNYIWIFGGRLRGLRGREGTNTA